MWCKSESCWIVHPFTWKITIDWSNINSPNKRIETNITNSKLHVKQHKKQYKVANNLCYFKQVTKLHNRECVYQYSCYQKKLALEAPKNQDPNQRLWQKHFSQYEEKLAPESRLWTLYSTSELCNRFRWILFVNEDFAWQAL